MPGIYKDLAFSFGKIAGKTYVVNEIFGSRQILPVFQGLEFNELHMFVVLIKIHPGSIVRKIVNDPDVEIFRKLRLGQQIFKNGMGTAGHASAPECLI